MSPQEAAELAPPPKWADQPDYQRTTHRNGRDGDILVFDTATIVSDHTVTVALEWQTDVLRDGTVECRTESLKLVTGDDTTFIESAHLVNVVSALCRAAILAGVTL